MSDEGVKANGAADGPVVVKKYANRRLYNTRSSSYVTLEDLCRMVKDGVEFVVRDAKTGEDITRSVLTQIIVEEEAKGQNLLPISFLRRLIAFYGDNLQGMLAQYLDFALRGFSQNQEEMRKTMTGAFGGMFPFGDLDEMSRRNLALFENTMRMFQPFAPAKGSAAAPGATDAVAGGAGADKARQDETLAELKSELARMQRRLDDLDAKEKRKG
jgi:polyhydroxyalkanoate synthesis repressor PhaR